MQIKAINRKFFGYYRLSGEQFNGPGMMIPALYGYDISLAYRDIEYPLIDSVNKKHSDKLFSPYQLSFGWSPAEVKSVLGNPIVQIDNSKAIDGHSVLVFKRHIGSFSTCSQVHFVNSQLFLVVEEVKKLFQPGVFIAKPIFQLLGYDTSLILDDALAINRLKDSAGNLMVIQEDIFLNIRVQAPSGIEKAGSHSHE